MRESLTSIQFTLSMPGAARDVTGVRDEVTKAIESVLKESSAWEVGVGIYNHADNEVLCNALIESHTEVMSKQEIKDVMNEIEKAMKRMTGRVVIAIVSSGSIVFNDILQAHKAKAKVESEVLLLQGTLPANPFEWPALDMPGYEFSVKSAS